MPFCRACGGKSPEDSLFCAHCGYRLQPLSEEATRVSDPQTTQAQARQTLPPETSPLLSQPLQAVPINNGEEEEEHRILPPVAPPEAPAPENVPAVQGTPQVGTVPSIPGGAATAAATFTAATMAKVLLIAATCAAVIFAGIKAAPILFHAQTKPSRIHKIVTVPMPPTQVSCPTAGTARAAIIKPLALGNDQNSVYVESKSTNNTPLSATLYRYDVTTGKTIEILHKENADITNAEVSADGQWVIFTSNVSGVAAIQMVRMDGQGLQTLYCLPPTQYSYENVILTILLSPDQKQLAFVTGLDLATTFSLLNMTNGTVQTALQPSPGGFTFYEPVMWLNNTQLYLWRYPIGQSALFLLNTKNGSDQPESALTDVTGFLTTFDVSPDHTQLFTGVCQVCGQGIFIGPSTLSVQSATGTLHHVIYTAKGALGDLLAAPQDTLLFSVNSSSEDPSRPADTSQDGVWKIHVDGSGLTRLSNQAGFAIGNHQDISNDGKWYLISSSSSLLFASLDGGGAPIQFASVTNTKGMSLTAVGWTTM